MDQVNHLSEATFEVEGSLSSASSLDDKDLLVQPLSAGGGAFAHHHATALEKTSMLQQQHQQVVGTSSRPAGATQQDAVYDRDYRLPSSFAQGGAQSSSSTSSHVVMASNATKAGATPPGIGEDRDYRLPSSFFSTTTATREQPTTRNGAVSASGCDVTDGRDYRLPFITDGRSRSQQSEGEGQELFFSGTFAVGGGGPAERAIRSK
jgi:hypothetical protein